MGRLTPPFTDGEPRPGRAGSAPESPGLWCLPRRPQCGKPTGLADRLSLPASDRCGGPRFHSREPRPCGDGHPHPALCPEARGAFARAAPPPAPATSQTGHGACQPSPAARPGTPGSVCAHAHTRAHAHRRKAGPRPLPGEGRALAGPPGAFRPLPACAAISSPGRGRLPPLPGCKWPAPGTACPLRRPCSAWPGSECGWPGRGPAFPRQQPGTQVACPPTVCFGGPWLGRTTRPSGWWSSWPRSDRGLRGPRGNDAGGHPQSDPWPPNTGPPLGPPPQQGDAKHLCICVHGAHAAARPPRGHASPHSAHAERAWALEDVRPGFESHPNPHDPVRTRSASEPGTLAAGRRGARPALQALLGLGPQSPSLRGVRSVTCATTRQGHLLSPLSR